MRSLFAGAALLLLVAVPATAHPLQEGDWRCSDGLPIVTGPNWIVAFSQHPVDQDNLTSDPYHAISAIGRTSNPCLEIHWPCQVSINPCLS